MTQAKAQAASYTREQLHSIVAEAVAQECSASFSSSAGGGTFDSLIGAGVTLKLEEQFGIRIPDGEITSAHMRSLEAIVDLVIDGLKQ